MKPPPPPADIPERNRREVIRDVLVFQVKLVFDGLRDLLLAPASLIAAVIGVLMSKHPGEPFYRLLQAGKRTETWLNLFGAAQTDEHPSAADGDLDALVNKLETLAADQDERERLKSSVRGALDRAAGSLKKPPPDDS